MNKVKTVVQSIKASYTKKNVQAAGLAIAIAFAITVFSNSITEVDAPSPDNYTVEEVREMQRVYYEEPEEEDKEEENELEVINLGN